MGDSAQPCSERIASKAGRTPAESGETRMRKIRTRTRMRSLAVAMCMAMAAVGLTATSASALNHDNYGLLKNAQKNQFCLDMRSEDPVEGRKAQLWNCTKASEQ